MALLQTKKRKPGDVITYLLKEKDVGLQNFSDVQVNQENYQVGQ